MTWTTEAEAQEFRERRDREKSECRHCKAPIFWTQYLHRRFAMDWDPVQKGDYNLRVDQYQGERVIKAEDNFRQEGTHNRHECREPGLGRQPLKQWLDSREELQEHYT